MKLLLLCEYSTLNGGEQSMLSTLPSVHEAGFEPIVICPAEGELAEALGRRAIETVPFRFLGDGKTRRPLAELREELARCIAQVSPDLFHANSLSMGRLSGPVAAEAGITSISHLRDIVKLGPQAIRDLNCHRRLLAVSEATRRHHLAQGLNEEKTFTLYNGVDLTKFSPRTPTGYLHRELQLPLDARLIAVIGQIGLRKGQEVFVRAAESLAERWPNVHFLLIGERCSSKAESREFEASLHHAAHTTLKDRLHFLGVRGDIESLLAELTILVHPARQEPLGRVLLEAGAAGVPIVATDVGGTGEIFPTETHSAILIPPDDPSAIAGEIDRILSDELFRLQLSQGARRRIEAVFDLRFAVDNLLFHYREVVG